MSFMLYCNGLRRRRRSLTKWSQRRHFQTPVAVVGGGTVGMLMSVLLSRFGVSHVLLERLPDPKYISDGQGQRTLSPNDSRSHPRAHVLHSRSMEILRECGLEPVVYDCVPPSEHWRKFRYCNSVLGEDYATDDHFRTDEYRFSTTCSPCRIAQLSQPRLDQILHKEALDLAKKVGAELKYNSTVIGLQKHKKNGIEGVQITVQDSASGETRNLDFQYVVVADGAGSSIRKLLGIESTGLHNMESFSSIHFSSKKLGLHVAGNNKGAMLSFIFNEKIMGVVVSHDIRLGEWVVHVPFFPPVQKFEDFAKDKEAYALQVVLDCLGPKLSSTAIDDIQVHSIRPWGMHGICAQRFSSLEGHAFLVGDAAHQFPPSGGFGVNTGLADAHNLAWKLAHALSMKNQDYALSLLSTYDHERRNAAYYTLSVAIDSYRRGLEPAKALGLDRSVISAAVSLVSTPGPLNSSTDAFSGKQKKKIVERLLWLGKQHLRVPVDLLCKPIKSVVEDHKALPLIFPRTDKGIRYQDSKALLECDGDTTGHVRKEAQFWLHPPFPRQHQTRWDPHRVLVGGILPHAWLKKDENHLSTVDLPGLFLGKYIFVCVDDVDIATLAQKYFQNLKVKVVLIQGIGAKGQALDNPEVSCFKLRSSGEAFVSNQCILVRPDCHVTWHERECKAEELMPVKEFLDQMT